MKTTIQIVDLDQSGPEEITVHYSNELPEYYMRNVIDLASIVGSHHVAREAYISEYQAEFNIPGVLC